jgi:hypothetical protein
MVVPAAILALSFSHASAADPPECPPGEWFCEEEEVEEPPGREVVPDEAPSGPRDASDWSSDERDAPERSRWRSADGERARIDVRRRSERERSDDDRDQRRPSWSSPWSVNLRVQGLMLGNGRRGRRDARMGGVGASLRYAVSPVVTLDFGLDSILGTDYNGYDRSEVSFSVSSLLYLNQHHLIRTYGILGLNASSARVDVTGDDQAYRYFGAHAGLGLDIRLDRRVALNLDLLGFMRGRTDERAAREPEFTDDLGRVSNTSGGGLFRAGINVGW